MRKDALIISTCLFVSATTALAQDVPPSVYPPPEPMTAVEEENLGKGVQFLFDGRYLTDYVWRGIERFDLQSEDNLNLQVQSKVSLDLGKLPHPFIDFFVNIAENDPESSFQEVRPTVGFDWPLRPFVFSLGHTSYIFPDRDSLDTSEVFARFEFDDSGLWRTEKPVLSPYVFGAFDYDTYDGIYLEAGLKHTLEIERTGLSFVFHGKVGYVNGLDGLFSTVPVVGDNENDTGFQHYEVGVTGIYRLNEAFNIPERFGNWSVVGYLNFTDGIDNELLSTTQVWGGAGLRFEF